jgi:predicted metal-dependent phosphotriesterase family hydrolase
VKDNLLMNDVRLAERELLEFKKAGGDTVIDATSIGRDPEALRRISRATGLNVIAGCRVASGSKANWFLRSMRMCSWGVMTPRSAEFLIPHTGMTAMNSLLLEEATFR